MGRDSSALESSRAARFYSCLDGAAMTLWPNKTREPTGIAPCCFEFCFFIMFSFIGCAGSRCLWLNFFLSGFI